MSSFRKFSCFTALASLVLLGACGFQPLYGKHAAGSAPGEFANIRVLPIKDRIGQMLHNHLLTALNPRGRPGNPRYLLDTQVTESSSSLGVRKSGFATRANLRATANFSLRGTGGGEVLFSGISTITVSYNILDSDFATLSAKKDARARAIREISEDMRVRLGAYFSQVQSVKK